MTVKTAADLEAERAALFDQTVADKAANLDDRLRLIEKQNADELARFVPAPKAAPKASKK